MQVFFSNILSALILTGRSGACPFRDSILSRSIIRRPNALTAAANPAIFRKSHNQGLKNAGLNFRSSTPAGFVPDAAASRKEIDGNTVASSIDGRDRSIIRTRMHLRRLVPGAGGRGIPDGPGARDALLRRRPPRRVREGYRLLRRRHQAGRHQPRHDPQLHHRRQRLHLRGPQLHRQLRHRGRCGDRQHRPAGGRRPKLVRQRHPGRRRQRGGRPRDPDLRSSLCPHGLRAGVLSAPAPGDREAAGHDRRLRGVRAVVHGPGRQGRADHQLPAAQERPHRSGRRRSRASTGSRTARSTVASRTPSISVPASTPTTSSPAAAPRSPTARSSATASSGRAASSPSSTRPRTPSSSPIAAASTGRPARSSPDPTPSRTTSPRS